MVDSRRINALPLNGRNYAQLALLGAGVAPAEPGSRVETTFGFSANGARSLQNNFLLDGIDNNANLGDVLNGSAYVVQPSVDAIAEFKVETNSYSAEFGRGNGAIMNAVIKSGTNQIHGNVWEFLRNEKFDAINAFDNSASSLTSRTSSALRWADRSSRTRPSFSATMRACAFARGCRNCPRFPPQDEIGGDFSSFLDLNTVAPQVDPTTGLPIRGPRRSTATATRLMLERFSTRARRNNNFAGQSQRLCGVPIGDHLHRAADQQVHSNPVARTPHRSARRRNWLICFPRPMPLSSAASFPFRSQTQRN